MRGFPYFLGLWIEFALRGSVRQADRWQVVGGTALPSLAIGIIFQLVGLPVPTFESAELAAYLGYGLVAWIVFRFLFIAPYALWRDQFADAAKLRLELSRPEQIELAYISKARSKARMRLATAIRIFQWHMFHPVQETDYMLELSRKMVKLHARVGEGEALGRGIGILHDLWREDPQYGSQKYQDLNRRSMAVAHNLQEFLHGRITAETLALRLPLSTEPEKQQ